MLKMIMISLFGLTFGQTAFAVEIVKSETSPTVFRLPSAQKVKTLIEKGGKIYPPLNNGVFEYFLPVGDGHHIRVEVSGNQKGIPLIYMHGGPGFPAGPLFRQMADPKIYRIIQVDERGAGESYQDDNQPLFKNNTQAVLEDFEKIRISLKVDRWIIMGGSWGTTLALLYAEKYPTRVSGLILRGVYLGRSKDTSGLYGAIAANKYPKLWNRFLSYVPNAHTSNIVENYENMMRFGTLAQKKLAVHAADEYEGSLIHANISPITLSEDDAFPDLNGMMIEYYYIMHHMFMGQNDILDNIETIRDAHIPTIIIQGQRDHIVSPDAARELAHALPEAILVELPDTGHSMSEPRIQAGLVEATNIFADK